MFVPKDALLTTGSRARTRQLPTRPACPPSFSISIRQFDCLYSFFFFSFFLPCRNPAYPSDLSKSSIPAPDRETPRSRAPAGLPAASSEQNMPCATSRHGRLTLSLPFTAVSSPGGVFWSHGNFCQLFSDWKRSSRHAGLPPLPPAQTFHRFSQTSQPISAFWYQIWALPFSFPNRMC